MSATTLRDAIKSQLDTALGTLTGTPDTARLSIANAFAQAVYADASLVNGTATGATAAALGLVKISGTPTDASNPVVYVKEQADTLLSGKASLAANTFTGFQTVKVGAQSLVLQEPDTTTTHTYIAWKDSTGTRRGYIGIPSNGSPTMEWGNENLNGSINLKTNGTGQVQVNGFNVRSASSLNTGTLSDTLLSSNVVLKNATNTFAAYQEFVWGTAVDWLLAGRIPTDTSTFRRVVLRMDGQMEWGNGAGVRDVTLRRSGVGKLEVSGDLRIVGTLTAGQIAGTRQTIAQSTATCAIDWTVGMAAAVTLSTGVTAVTLTNPVAGATYTLEVIQDATGGRGFTGWPASVLWAGGAAYTPTLTPNKRDLVTLYWNGTNYLGAFYKDY